MPICRVPSGPGHVIYVFNADDDEEAERFARRLSSHSQPADHRTAIRCVRVENLSGDDWRRVCAWIPGS
jgi:hypothetical protein